MYLRDYNLEVLHLLLERRAAEVEHKDVEYLLRTEREGVKTEREGASQTLTPPLHKQRTRTGRTHTEVEDEDIKHLLRTEGGSESTLMYSRNDDLEVFHLLLERRATEVEDEDVKHLLQRLDSKSALIYLTGQRGRQQVKHIRLTPPINRKI